MIKVSILTPSYNQELYIEQNIRSVQAQDYPHVEHIVIDGGSTDGTINILKTYPHLQWISEKDGGQSDALNKGFIELPAISWGGLIRMTTTRTISSDRGGAL